jgi:hypothetical protein
LEAFEMSKVVYISPGAARRGFTFDAAASSPLSPISDIHARLVRAEEGIRALCILAEPDDAGGERNAETGAAEGTEDRRRRSRDAMGARSWSGKSGSGYGPSFDSVFQASHAPIAMATNGITHMTGILRVRRIRG